MIPLLLWAGLVVVLVVATDTNLVASAIES